MLSRFPLRFRRSAGLEAERATPCHALFFLLKGISSTDQPTSQDGTPGATSDPWRRDGAESVPPHRFG